MPGDFRRDRGDHARVLFYILHARLRVIERPAFPAPSELQKAGRLLAKLAWMRGEIAESYHDVIARSEATKQSILSVASKLDCFAPLAMTVSNVV